MLADLCLWNIISMQSDKTIWSLQIPIAWFCVFWRDSEKNEEEMHKNRKYVKEK